MKSRHDDYKKSQGLNQIKALYKTTSGANADKVESALIDYNLKKRTKKCVNQIRGTPGEQPKKKTYIMYAATKKVKKKPS